MATDLRAYLLGPKAAKEEHVYVESNEGVVQKVKVERLFIERLMKVSVFVDGQTIFEGTSTRLFTQETVYDRSAPSDLEQP